MNFRYARRTDHSRSFMTPTTQLALDGGRPSLANGHNASSSSSALPGLDVSHAVPPPDAAEWNHPKVAKLERHWQRSTGRAHVVACRSGRVALHIALAGLELRNGDEVICPADAIELAHALSRSDLVAVPADLDPRTLHIAPEEVERAVTDRTQAIVVLDSHGTTADYNAIDAVADRHGLALIEDGSQSLGAAYDRRPVGSLGEVSLCSLTGEDVRSSLGTCGLFATDNDALAAGARRMLLVNNDLVDDAGADGNATTGWTCQLSGLDAAVADTQLHVREERLAARCVNGSHLRDRLRAVPGIWIPDIVRSATHVYTSLPMVVVPDELGLPEAAASTLRDTVIDCLTAEGLWVDRWQPQPLGIAFGLGPTLNHAKGDFPVAEAMLATGLVLGRHRSPFDPPQTIATMDRIADCYHKVFVTNTARLRSLTEQRFNASVMT